MTPPLKITSPSLSDALPGFIPGAPDNRLFPDKIVQGGLTKVGIDPSLVIEGRPGKVPTCDLQRLFDLALSDYQAMWMKLDDGQLWFPYALHMDDGQTLHDLNQGQYRVTSVRRRPDGGRHWNADFDGACGQIVRLTPEPEAGTVLRLDARGKLRHSAAFPDENEEEVANFLERTQLKEPAGLFFRVLRSEPWIDPRKPVDGSGDFVYRHPIVRDPNLRLPGFPGYQFEALDCPERALCEFIVLAATSGEAEQLLRYVHAILRYYDPAFKQAGLEQIFWLARGPDGHLSQGERWPYKSEFHVRRTQWVAKTGDRMLRPKRTIDLLRLTSSATASPAAVRSGGPIITASRESNEGRLAE